MHWVVRVVNWSGTGRCPSHNMGVAGLGFDRAESAPPDPIARPRVRVSESSRLTGKGGDGLDSEVEI